MLTLSYFAIFSMLLQIHDELIFQVNDSQLILVSGEFLIRTLNKNQIKAI